MAGWWADCLLIMSGYAAGKNVSCLRNRVSPKKSGGGSLHVWLPIVALGLVVGLLYVRIMIALVGDWLHDPNYSHGFLIIPFSGFLVWRKRKLLIETPVRPSLWGLATIVAAMAILIVGTLGAELFLSRSSLIILLSGMVLYFGGWRWLRVLAFPLAVLFLMIPLPVIVFNQISLPLQFLSSRLATGFLSFTGVPVLREGNVIRLPAMSLEVAQACSGIRSLISLLALAVIYGYLFEPALRIRVILVGASVPIAVLANALRIMATGLIVQYWNPEMASGVFHEFSGWLIFVFTLFLLYVFHRVLRFGSVSVFHV